MSRQPPQHMPFPQQQPPPMPPQPTRREPQYQAYPQQHYAPPPPPPPPMEEHQHHHAYAYDPPRGPAYGQFVPQPQHGGPAPVKVIKGGYRRESTDSDGGGGPSVIRREKRKKVVNQGREIYRAEFYRSFETERSRLSINSRILLSNPQDSPLFAIRLYPHSLKRSAQVAQIELEEEWALESAQNTFDEEKSKVEDEWKKGKERIRERLMEGLEERRKKAREEMSSDGVLADAPAFEPSANTRPSKANKPPPFVLAAPHPFGAAGEEMASPFPLPLTAHAGGPGGWGANGRKRPKGVGPTGGLTLGKAIQALAGLKESEIEADLGEVKKAVKRKRRAGQGVAGQYRDQ